MREMKCWKSFLGEDEWYREQVLFRGILAKELELKEYYQSILLFFRKIIPEFQVKQHTE